MVPSAALPAHCRWTLSCMAATSERGATGFLRRSELRSLLLRANAGSDVPSTEIDAALRSVEEDRERLAAPEWLTRGSSRYDSERASGGREQSRRSDGEDGPRRLNAWQVMGLLLRLSLSSQEITSVFNRIAIDGEIDLEGWLTFVRTEQAAIEQAIVDDDGLSVDIYDGLSVSTYDNDASPKEQSEMTEAREVFERAASAVGSQSTRGLSLLQFTLQLLSQHNDVVAPARDPDTNNDLAEPLSHYWMATSHNVSSALRL
jgi:hypothetical protein